MNRYDKNEYLNYKVYQTLQFWNWKTNAFDVPGTIFDYDIHVTEDYYTEGGAQHIKDILKSNNNCYVATIIEGNSCHDPLVFEPGWHFANRFGYVVYRADQEVQQDYWSEGEWKESLSKEVIKTAYKSETINL